MLSTDVAAAPATSTSQDGAPFVGASRRDSGQPPDDFATMFDRCAGDATPDSTLARPSRAVPRGVGLQPDQAVSLRVATGTSLSVAESDDAAAMAGTGEAVDAELEPADEGDTPDDLGVPAFDPRFFVPVPLPVPPASQHQAAPALADAAASAQPAVPDVLLAGHGRLTPFVATQGSLHSHGPVSGVTPRPMGATASSVQSLPIDEPIDDPTVPVELDAVAVGAFDPSAAGLSSADISLTPEQRTAVQDAVDRLAAGSPAATSSVTPQADTGSASPLLAASTAPVDADARRLALSSIRTALAASAQGTQPAVADNAADTPSTVSADPTLAAGTSSVVADSDARPQGLPRAVGATSQHAMAGLHRAAAHASGTADAPVALQEAEAGIADVTTQATDTLGPTQAANASASADRGTSDAPTVQAAQVTPEPKALVSSEDPQQPAVARTRGNSARQTVQDAPVATPRPSARVAHAIAAFQAAAHSAGTSPAAAQAVFTSVATPTALLDRELPTQIVQAIRVQFDNGSGEARVRLNPGFLGGMTVGVQVDGASVVASLQASSAEVREWLQRNEQVLRQALADQGLQLDRLVIVEEEAKAGTDDEAGQRSSQQQEREPQRRPRRPVDEGTFEVEL